MSKIRMMIGLMIVVVVATLALFHGVQALGFINQNAAIATAIVASAILLVALIAVNPTVDRDVAAAIVAPLLAAAASTIVVAIAGDTTATTVAVSVLVATAFVVLPVSADQNLPRIHVLGYMALEVAYPSRRGCL